MRRRLLLLVGFVVGTAAGMLLYRRGARGRRERIDLYYDDGSMVSFVDGSPDAAALLPLARRVLAAAEA